jgi:hypothetical protein
MIMGKSVWQSTCMELTEKGLVCKAKPFDPLTGRLGEIHQTIQNPRINTISRRENGVPKQM